jgi:hypothetical protein
MSIFSRIKDAIFGHRTATPQAQTTAAPQPAGQTSAAPTATQPQPQPATAQVDVQEVLLQISRDKGNPDLNYKTSIVDLLKLLGIDSSLENRKELATELGYQGEKDGSAEMNIWLHKEVMRQLAAHGGKVPASLTD